MMQPAEQRVPPRTQDAPTGADSQESTSCKLQAACLRRLDGNQHCFEGCGASVRLG